MKKTPHKTFHILQMKTHFEKELHFENESSFPNPFWKWKHVFKPGVYQSDGGVNGVMQHIRVLSHVFLQVGLAPQLFSSRRARGKIPLAFWLARRPSDALLNPTVWQFHVLGVDRGWQRPYQDRCRCWPRCVLVHLRGMAVIPGYEFPEEWATLPDKN